MIFGEYVHAAAEAAPAEWVSAARDGEWWTVGSLVPTGYDQVVEVTAPDPSVDDWWSEYRQLFVRIFDIGVGHTTSPERAWIGISDIHGFESGARSFYYDPAEVVDLAAMEDLQRQVREEDRRRNASIAAQLATLPMLHALHRSYYLLSGTVIDSGRLVNPGIGGGWLRPDLVWPEDRSWSIACDVDFWSVFVAASASFASELLETFDGSRIIDYTDSLPPAE